MDDAGKSREQLLAEIQRLRQLVTELQQDESEEDWEDSSERRYLDELAFLAHTAIGFVELGIDDDIHRYIAEKIHELIGDCAVGVSEASEDGRSLTFRAAVGIGSILDKATSYLGQSPIGLNVVLDDEGIARVSTPDVHIVPGGLGTILHGRYPKLVTDTLGKMWGLGDIHEFPFLWDKTLYGTAIILLKEGNELHSPDALQTFRHQASVALQRHRALRTAQRKERKYRNLFDGTPVPAFRADPDSGAVVECNRTFAEFFGFASPRDLVQQSAALGALMGDEAYGRAVAAMKSNGIVTNLEVNGRHSNGRWFWATVNCTANPESHTLDGTLMDITNRKLAQDESNLRALMLDQIEDAVAATDLEGTIVFWNTAAEAMFKRERTEVLGLPLAEVMVPPATKNLAMGVIRRALEVGSWVGDLPGRLPDTTTFSFNLRLAVYRDESGTSRGLIGACVDLAEHAGSQDDIASQRQALELIHKMVTSHHGKAHLLAEELVEFVARLFETGYVRLERVVGVECRLVHGLNAGIPERDFITDLSGTPMFMAFQTGRTYVSHGDLAQKYPRFTQALRHTSAAIVCIPLKDPEGQVVGLLTAMSTGDKPFNADDIRLVEVAAECFGRVAPDWEDSVAG